MTLRIDTDDRIALLGSNGNGKSTLVKLLAGKLQPFSGQVTRADKLSVGYFAQHQVDELNLDGSPYDHIRKLMPDAPETKVRARTGAIGFSGKAGDTLVKSLSGGEKARLLLGLATFFGPNMIILDEPTNHLDIDSRAALAEAINEFPGAVIMVSHDRYLIEACADQLWVVADQTVTAYDGDLDDYRRMVLSSRGTRNGSRDRGNERAKENVTENEKPERGKSEKRTPLKQTDRRRRGRDRAHQRHHRQDRHRAGAAGSVHARSEAGRPAQQGARRRRKRAAARRRRLADEARDSISSTQAARAEPIARRNYVAGFFFAFGLPLRLRHRLGAALDRRQPSRREGVDAGALAARIGHDRHAIAARDCWRD